MEEKKKKKERWRTRRRMMMLTWGRRKNLSDVTRSLKKCTPLQK
jgi:hypothetical protein